MSTVLVIAGDVVRERVHRQIDLGRAPAERVLELARALLRVLVDERDRLFGDLLEPLREILALLVGERAEALLHEARQIALEILGLFHNTDVCIARLSRKAATEWGNRLSAVREVRVLAMLCRNSGQDLDEIRRERYQVPKWEVPVVEVVFANGAE